MFFATVQVSPAQPIRKVPTLPATCTAVGSASSSNAVLYQGRVYQCNTTNTWTFAVGQTAALTSGRVPYATTGGVLTDSSLLGFNGTSLTISSASATTVWNAAGILIFHNTNATANNWTGMEFRGNAGVITSGIASVNTTHASGYADLVFSVRGTPGFNSNALRIFSDTGVAINSSTNAAQFFVNNRTAAQIGGIFRAAGSQTANILETQNSSGTALTTIDAVGRVYPVSVAFASLGTPSNGAVVYCSDCTKATPCAGSGNGALAKRLNGAWDCD